MRIDINTRATEDVRNAVDHPAAASTGKAAEAITGQREDTAQFLFDRVKTQALTPDSAQVEAGNLRIDALRKVLADGSYNVPPELIAGAIVAEARV
jgi:anti-sigma28 factor (negative regulator of flagellin synthesis)